MRLFMTEIARPEPSRIYRWMVLLFVAVAIGGNYYIYDSINPLERIFIDKLGSLGDRVWMAEFFL